MFNAYSALYQVLCQRKEGKHNNAYALCSMFNAYSELYQQLEILHFVLITKLLLNITRVCVYASECKLATTII